VHLGRVGNTRPLTDKRWGELINIAAVLTIDYLTPAYNERGKRRMRILEPVLLLNYGRRHRLPLCPSNLAELIEDLGALKMCGGATTGSLKRCILAPRHVPSWTTQTLSADPIRRRP
jgi:hypothetical protein